tara:strand:+ start:1495 stop:2610 length:1116 start_codon:yes stop_codon:yes gene_type:complete
MYLVNLYILIVERYYKKRRKKSNISPNYLRKLNGGALHIIQPFVIAEGDDDTHRSLFRLDIATYHSLLAVFEPVYNRARLARFRRINDRGASGYGRPHRRLCSANKALQITLRKLAGGSSHIDTQLLNGVEGSVLSRTLHHSVTCLLQILRHIPGGSMDMLTVARARKLATMARNYIAVRYGYEIAGCIIGAIDGKIGDRERPGDDAWQQTNYNGKSNAHAAKGLVIQLFDGTYGASVVNFIGLAHDSKITTWLDLCDVMSHLPPEYVIAGDTAFGTSSRLIRPLSMVEYTREMTIEQISLLSDCCKVLSSLRISSEWGIGALTNTFRIFQEKLPADDIIYGGELWELCMRLYNLMVRNMRTGQVYNVFKD